MSRYRFATVLLLSVSAAVHSQQHHSASGVSGPVTTAELELHGRTPQAALGEPFPDAYDVTLGKGADSAKRTLASCRDVLALGETKHSAGSTPDNNSLHAAEARCYALDWIANAKPSASRQGPAFSLRNLQVRQLPPELALALSDDEVAGAADASRRGNSILAIAPDAKLRPLTASKARLTTADWTALLTVYACGDLTGGGKEQVVLRWDASATGGSYTATKVFLLERGPRGYSVVRQR